MTKPRKLWRFYPSKQDVTKQIATTFNISEIIAQILVNRGIVQLNQAQEFLYGELQNVGNPFLLKDMDKAIERITKAIQTHERIVIYGDYDVDGITATVLMFKILKQLGAKNIDYYIPDRQNEGYGLNRDALESLIEAGTNLVISVDCGISAVQEIEGIKNKLDVIITDHHEPPSNLPAAFAIINPKQESCGYPDKQLSGVGVAFKVCQALWKKLKCMELTSYLDLVAVGTIADIVTLTHENRILVKYGLKELQSTENIGLRALLHSCGLKASEVDAGKVGYVLAPRLNATGRLVQASLAVELLTTEDSGRAAELAERLEYENTQRQQVEKEILEKAEAQLQYIDIMKEKVLVLAGENWHPGVIGIVASRLVDRYYRPTIVISLKDGIGKGSCRSIRGFNIYEALHACGDLLLQFGGHSQAAGLSISVQQVSQLKERLERIAGEWLNPEDYVPILNIDAIVGLEEIKTGFIEQLACLAPFGMGNPSPVFACENVTLSETKAIGNNGRHLKFKVIQKKHRENGIAWEMGELADRLQGNHPVDIAFQPEYNIWNGQCNLQLKTHDIRQTEKNLSELDKLYLADHTEGAAKNILQAERFFTKIVGVTFDNRQELIPKLTPGQTLYLHREPCNRYDVNAIKLETDSGVIIGYLKAELAKVLAPAMDAGQQYCCNITAITGGNNCPFGVNVLIYREYLEKKQELFQEKMVDDEVIRSTLLGNREYHQSQKEVLDQLALRRNVLAIMGTGRGKSAIFQAHAALMALRDKKMTIILYPLRALVNDQYLHLANKMGNLGIKVYKGNGTLSAADRAALFCALYKGEVDILLTTPEFAEANLEVLTYHAERIGFFVVDECHHISHSAKQRPIYRRLHSIINKLERPCLLGVTATADTDTAKTIQDVLGVEKVIIDKTVRENLSLADFRNHVDKLQYITDVVRRQEKTLIFVNSRKKAVELACHLREHLPELEQQIGFYHAGLSNEWRSNVENWFRQGILHVVVATSAFGEGVDFSDIRHVIQYHLAFNLTTFNQQCGRAGRDGLPATIHLIFGHDDIKLNQLILKEAAPERKTIGSIYLVLKREYRKYGLVDLTNKQIAEQVYEDYHECISERGVSTGLKVLEELHLLWRETSGKKRILFLNPEPGHKLDLEQSVSYYEGLLEKTEFSLFAHRIMNATRDEILTCINRPLYPEEEF